MPDPIRRRLSYANVMSTLAAFGVLAGGGAFAASKIGPEEIRRNAVRSEHIKNKQVKARDLKFRAVKRAKLAPGAVDSGRVADASLRGIDVANGSLGGIDVANGSLSGVDVEDGSLSGAEILNRSLGTAEFARGIPAALLTRSAKQSIVGGGTLVALAFNRERYDTASMHSNSASNSRVRAPADGIYALSGSVSWEVDPNGIRVLRLRKNGNSGDDLAADTRDATSMGFTRQTVSALVRLKRNDYVELWVTHNGVPASQDIVKVNEASPELSMTWLAPGP